MRALRELLHRLVGTLRPGRRNDDLEDELRAHIELAAEVDERRGASPDEAQRRARVRSGGTTQAVDALRAQRGLPWLADLGRDIRYACRVLGRNRGFTAAAVLSLGLGIGANTAIFSLIDAVLVRPLPVEEPGALYFLAHGEGDAPPADSNYPLLERYRSVPAFSGVTAYQTATFRVAAGDSLEQVPGQFVSGNYHAVVGVPMRLGRGFATEPDQPGSDDGLAVISESYWTRRFGRSPDVVGQSLSVDGRRVTIVGVTAAPFAGFVPGAPADITVPLSIRIRQTPDFLTSLGGFTQMPIVARLERRTSEAQALAAADGVFQQFMELPDVQWARTGMPEAYSRARLLPAGHGQNGLQRLYREPLLALMGMAALVLLVACANVANLLLARSSARAKEMALRLSIGSGRGRLIRQLLTESVVLAIAGGALGLLFAYWGTNAAVSLLSTWHDTIVLDVAPNGRALAFTTLVALATGAILGVVPALKATRVGLSPALKGSARGAGGATRGSLFGRGLIVAQVALCVVIVAVAALLGRSVHALRAKDSGFDPARVLLVNVDAWSSQLGAARLDALYAELVLAVRALPGVTSAAASTMTPLGMSLSLRGLHLPGFPETADARGVLANVVSDDYFRTLGVRIRRGRALDRDDVIGSRRVAVINERTARYVFGSDDPIGRTIAWLRTPEDRIEIVGVTEDSNQENLRDDAPRMVYTSLAQEGTAPRRLQLAAKTTGDPAAMASSIRETVRRIGPDLVVTEVRTMADQVDGTIVRERSLSWIAIAFAALATVLACVGLYGVMSYQVARRTHEIGIRLALGASERSIFGGVIGQTLALAATGIAIGIAGALVSTHAIAAFLYGVTPRDPLTLASVGLALAVTALAAGYFPARRAARINPLRAIRTE